MNLPSAPPSGNFYWAYGICASLIGALAVYVGFKTRWHSMQLLRQVEREKERADKLANFVIPAGLSLAAKNDLNTLLEKILVEAKSLSLADGGTLYLMTPEKTLRFVMVLNDSLKIAMGGTSSGEVTLPPLNLYDQATGSPNQRNIATSCALGGKSISIPDVYAEKKFDFSGAKAFDQRMNYRTLSVLCVPLKDTRRQVIGVLQLINAQAPETGRVIPFDEHLRQMIELLGLLAAAALESYLKIKTLTDEIAELKIQIDEVKKERQVAEITETDYFKGLQTRAREMRAKVKGRDQ
ncbi:MAG: GAF domain-containing protein [Methylacidiphilales bacterium]|nr:GAF domain-containing protein [Candidatus Methylacidiphilales bacterium]